MIGETEKENDLFFTCSLIEYMARKTYNTKKYIVEKLGKDRISKIYELASVYHSENIDKVLEEFVESANIEVGNYNHVEKCMYNVPSYFDMGKVYKRLIIMVSDRQEERYVDALIEVMSSWIMEKFDNYNSSMYYENPSYIYACYKEGKVL